MHGATLCPPPRKPQLQSERGLKGLGRFPGAVLQSVGGRGAPRALRRFGMGFRAAHRCASPRKRHCAGVPAFFPPMFSTPGTRSTPGFIRTWRGMLHFRRKPGRHSRGGFMHDSQNTSGRMPSPQFKDANHSLEPTNAKRTGTRFKKTLKTASNISAHSAP